MEQHFGSILDRFWFPNGAHMGSKMVKKRYQKSIKTLIEFWIDFGSSQDAVTTIDRVAAGANAGGGPPQKAIS